MDCRFESRAKELIAQFAREGQAELAEAGTLLDLETLTVQIGNMVTRELTQLEVTRRADALDEAEAKCPDCGRMCPRGAREPVILDGLRGELMYSQPKYDCRHCRRSFFPGGRLSGLGAAEHGYSSGAAEDDMGGGVSGEF
jgi:hypothetical protein